MTTYIIPQSSLPPLTDKQKILKLVNKHTWRSIPPQTELKVWKSEVNNLINLIQQYQNIFLPGNWLDIYWILLQLKFAKISDIKKEATQDVYFIKKNNQYKSKLGKKMLNFKEIVINKIKKTKLK